MPFINIRPAISPKNLDCTGKSSRGDSATMLRRSTWACSSRDTALAVRPAARCSCRSSSPCSRAAYHCVSTAPRTRSGTMATNASKASGRDPRGVCSPALVVIKTYSSFRTHQLRSFAVASLGNKLSHRPEMFGKGTLKPAPGGAPRETDCERPTKARMLAASIHLLVHNLGIFLLHSAAGSS